MQGKYHDAEEIFRQCLRLDRANFGPDDDESLGTEGDLATTFLYEGKYDEAMKSFSDLIPRDEKVFGANNTRTLHDRLMLANLKDETGKRKEAEMDLRELAEMNGG